MQLQLNYFTIQPRREIIIDGDSLSIQADIITGKVLIVDSGEKNIYDFSDIDPNIKYLRQHLAILENSEKNLCSFEDGNKIMKLIDKIKNF